MKRRKRRTADQVIDELWRMAHVMEPKKAMTGESFIAFNLWECLTLFEAMAQDFLDNPSIKGWKNTKDWMVDDHHYYALKNFNVKSKREADRMVKNGTAWNYRVSLEEVAYRLEVLEKEGE